MSISFDASMIRGVQSAVWLARLCKTHVVAGTERACLRAPAYVLDVSLRAPGMVSGQPGGTWFVRRSTRAQSHRHMLVAVKA
jgi:hypothetical protein